MKFEHFTSMVNFSFEKVWEGGKYMHSLEEPARVSSFYMVFVISMPTKVTSSIRNTCCVSALEPARWKMYS